MVLRMTFLAAPVLVRSERFPFRPGHRTLVSQRRKDHRTLCKPGHPTNQRSDRWGGRCNTCGDGKAVRRLAFPALGQRMQKPAASTGQVDQPAFGQQLWPTVKYSLE